VGSPFARNLQSASLQVFGKCVDVIFRSSSKETRLRTLEIVERMSRNHISLTGKILQRIGMPAFDVVVDFLRNAHNQRMIVELIHALRMATEPGRTDSEGLLLTKKRRPPSLI